MISSDIINNVLQCATVGIEFELFSNYNTDETRTKLISLLNKKIVKGAKSHSEFQPTVDTFKIEPDFSGGKKMIELITGPLDYNEAKSTIIKVLKWISENGYTSNRTSIHLNISFNDKMGKNYLSHMDTLKYILDFDEADVYKMFPNREKSVYAKSIKFINPANKYHLSSVDSISPKNFIMPDTKYYGINFSKLIKGYLEFRYLGGEKYEEKTDVILDFLDKFILSIYKSISEKGYSTENKKELNSILKNHEFLIKSYRSYNDFCEQFPDIKLSADLRNDPSYAGLYYANIRDHIYKILAETDLRKGYINYDSSTGKIQLKNVKITTCYNLENVDIVDSYISGTIKNCDIFYCKIMNTDLTTCNIFQETELDGCKLKDSYVNRSSILKNCYIFGKNGVMSGKMNGGIFREGRMTKHATFSDDVEIIEFEKIK